MGTLSLLLAAANFFIAGVQFATWVDRRIPSSLVWTVVNFAVGVYSMVAGVGAIVKTALGE
jgi:hypothetical protein